ncbi:MAG: HDOD domain-containing protein [Desulfovibrio sp.]|jgi:HD-like signal output (HDOD) protein|nr:HDOD domain-containing protein [Desulfovibrio sp.]
MKILDIASAQAGERLVHAAFSNDGRILLSPGDVLTDENLHTLKEEGVSAVVVESDSPAATQSQGTAPPEDLLQAVKEAERERFRLQDMEDAHITVLFEFAVERHGRMVLSKTGKVAPGGHTSPAFQTQRPPQIKIRTLLDSSQRMGTLPVVFHRLVEIINDPDASSAKISNIVAMDPALAAKLLRLVNSPFYAFASRIDSVPRAVALVGTRQLVMLAMGAILITAFKGVPVSLVNMQSFWAHSISCGVVARHLAVTCAKPLSESFFIAGLLHDISRLLIYSLLPNHTLYILTEAKRRQESVLALEKEALGFGHDELGAELLQLWRCPNELAQRVRAHHAPLHGTFSVDDVILPVADALTQALNYGSSGEIYIPPIPSSVWEKLGLSPEQLLEQCRTLDNKVRELRALLAPTN